MISDITITIVTYGETYSILEKTLNNLKEFKVILVDNSNNIFLKKKILDKYNNIDFIINKKNVGFSAGYNQATKLVKTKYTLILGPDCIISEKSIFILIKKLETFDNTILSVPTAYDDTGQPTYVGGPLPEVSEKNVVLNISGDTCVDNALGACMMFRTNDIKKENLFFDEKFFLYFSDDDLCRRIKNKNLSIIQTNEAQCIHKHGNLKIKNKYKKIFIREFYLSLDEYYYYFKINCHYKLLNKFKKKLLIYFFKLVIKAITLKIFECIRIYAKIYAYYTFKKNFIAN